MKTIDIYRKIEPKLNIVNAVKIEIDGFDDIETSENIPLVKMDNKICLFLGEYDNWYWVAPIDTLVAEKAADGEFEYLDYDLNTKELLDILSDEEDQ